MGVSYYSGDQDLESIPLVSQSVVVEGFQIRRISIIRGE
jgi:hypothetical protein